MKATKIILPIVLVLVALVAIFLLAPLKSYKEAKERENNIQYCMAPKQDNRPEWQRYLSFCVSYWRTVFTGIYSGGELPEIVVTPNKNTEA